MAALNLSSFWENSDTKCTLSSSIPTNIASQECILGIDEAGRGPVLGDVIYYVTSRDISLFVGPMVYGACYCPTTMKEQLKSMGFAGRIFCIICST